MTAVCLTCDHQEVIASEADLDTVACGCSSPHMGIVEGDEVVARHGARASAADMLAAGHMRAVEEGSARTDPDPGAWSWRAWAESRRAARRDSVGDRRS